MRTQPENISDPEKLMVKITRDGIWGSQYISKEKIPVWKFTFTVEQFSAFDDGLNPVGNLIKDSAGIPMIVKLEESSKIDSMINSTPELRNIYFEVIQDD